MTAARRRILRWGLRAAVLVGFLVLVFVDARMKGGNRAGFAPANADWVACAPHFTRVWTELFRNPVVRDFRKQWGAPYNKAELFVRTTSGIRPTPLRWSTWLGKKAVIFGSEKGIGWCVRPGLLLRGAHAINAAVSTQPDPESFRYGPYHYSWREGFLIFSTSPEVLREALGGNEVGAADSMGLDEFYVRWQAAPSGSLVISARDGLPVRGAFKSAVQGEGEAIHPWPGEPFLELNSSDNAVFVALAQFLRWQLSMLPGWCNVRTIVPDPSPLVAAAEQAGPVSNYGLALFAPESKGSRAPEFALRFHYQTDISAPPVIETPLMQSVVGPLWQVSSSEARLKALLGYTEAEPPTPGALNLELEWDRAGKAFEKHLRAVLEADDTLRESIEGTGIPAAQALPALGRLHIEGRHEDGSLSFSGELALPLPEGQQK